MYWLDLHQLELTVRTAEGKNGKSCPKSPSCSSDPKVGRRSQLPSWTAAEQGLQKYDAAESSKCQTDPIAHKFCPLLILTNFSPYTTETEQAH